MADGASLYQPRGRKDFAQAELTLHSSSHCSSYWQDCSFPSRKERRCSGVGDLCVDGIEERRTVTTSDVVVTSVYVSRLSKVCGPM